MSEESLREAMTGNDSPPSLPMRPYIGPPGLAFQRFTRWLKNEPYHQKGQYCKDDACYVCDAWRNINKEKEPTSVDVVACGFECGEKIALDALAALAMVQPPQPMIGNLRFGQALRNGFRTTLQRKSRPVIC